MAEAASPPAAPRPRPRWRSEVWAFLELFALCGFVVVQPLLEIIGGSPDFFIFHGVGSGEVVLLVALFTLVPPLVLWVVGLLVGLAGRRARRLTHAVSLGLLFALLAIQLGKHLTPVRGVVLTAVALLVAAVIMVGYLQLVMTRQLLRFAAVGPPVFVLLFAFASPSAAVVFTSTGPADGDGARVIGPNPPIVMVVFDEFPLLSLLDEDAEIDAERFPHFAELAGQSTWYRNATSVAGWTPYALPAMLTGRYPADHVAPHYSQHPDNLFSLFGDVYRIEASESISELCPPWQCGERAGRARGGLPVALAESASLWGEIVSPTDVVRDPYADFAEPTVAERLGAGAAAAELGPEFRFNRVGDNQPARYEHFLGRLAADPPPDATAPSFHFLHLLLPHTPWTYLPSGMRYYNVPGLPVDGQWWGRLALQRHLLQLEYTDRLLGETMRMLAEQGNYDDALVVVTADHGVSLTPGTAGRELDEAHRGAAELAWVPLFIKEPGQTEGVIDDRNWEHVDLLPTLADHAGIEVPWRTDGISALREERADGEKVYFNKLTDRRVLDGSGHFAELTADPYAFPPVPPAPLPALVGARVADLPVTAGPGGTEVDGVDKFAEVSPEAGFLPALVNGTVPRQVVPGTALAIAVNGRIGAVVPVLAAAEDTRRFAGLVEDEGLFVAGENRLELFLVTDDGSALQSLPLD